VTESTIPGHTAQSGRVIIERADSARPMYFSQKIGRDYASPAGGWTEHQNEATVMDRAKAEKMLEGALMLSAPYCKVVEVVA
jgi:hypothetical protein